MTELVLDVGRCMGYSTAVIAHMAEAVVAVEEDDAMAREAQDALIAAGADNAVVHDGPLAEGAAQHGPYDVIIVQGGVAMCRQHSLISSKTAGGLLRSLWKGALGEVRVGTSVAGQISWRVAFQCSRPGPAKLSSPRRKHCSSESFDTPDNEVCQ